MRQATSNPRRPRRFALSARAKILPVWNLLREHRVELFLFFCLWFAYGAAVNSRNQYEFNLQQAGVEAIVERHHFYLEGSSTPRLQMQVYYYDGNKPFGDVFAHDGHQYAAKQPGQFMAGAVAWFFLRLFGLDYRHHYTLTGAVVGLRAGYSARGGRSFAMVRQLTRKTLWPHLRVDLRFGTTAIFSGFCLSDAGVGALAMRFSLPC